MRRVVGQIARKRAFSRRKKKTKTERYSSQCQTHEITFFVARRQICNKRKARRISGFESRRKHHRPGYSSRSRRARPGDHRLHLALSSRGAIFPSIWLLLYSPAGVTPRRDASPLFNPFMSRRLYVLLFHVHEMPVSLEPLLYGATDPFIVFFSAHAIHLVYVSGPSSVRSFESPG